MQEQFFQIAISCLWHLELADRLTGTADGWSQILPVRLLHQAGIKGNETKLYPCRVHRIK